MLDAEIKEHDVQLEVLTAARALDLIKAYGMAAGTAAEMLLLVGDNPERIRSEAAFRQGVRRLSNPGIKRKNQPAPAQSKAATDKPTPHSIASPIVRMRSHQPTLDYVRRRTAEGKGKGDNSLLKRYLARQIFGYLCRPPRPTIPSHDTP